MFNNNKKENGVKTSGPSKVDAEEVTVAGSVTGQIKARHVILIKGAKVIADLIQDRLSIEPGAFFEGNCRQYEDDSSLEAIQLEYDERA